MCTHIHTQSLYIYIYFLALFSFSLCVWQWRLGGDNIMEKYINSRSERQNLSPRHFILKPIEKG